MDTSLLIPAYNAAAFLPDLLESAAQQTQPFAEILVYDDASSDDTADVAEAHGARVLRGTVNKGPAFGRNALLEAADTELVHLHDADDTFIAPRFVEVMSDLADSTTAAVCTWDMVEKDGAVRSFTYEDVDDWTRFLINGYAHLNAIVYPRTFLVEHGAFDEDLIQCDELLMNAKMAGYGLSFTYTEEVNALHERREGSLIDGLEPAEPHEWAIRMCERLLEHLNPSYHEAVGRKALYHTVGLAKAKASDEWVTRGIRVMERAGIETISAHGRVTRWISRLLGNQRAIQYIATHA